MLLMTAKADGRVVNYGQRPWADEPDPATVTVQDWTKPLPDAARDYRLVNGALVLDPLPPSQQEQDKAAIRSAVFTAAQSAEGVALTSLTAAQVRALLAVLLWESRGVTGDGKVRPLAQWVGQ